ncbi:MAG: hypothetical protein LW832_03245 [Parachlamydia sp.]|jgi:hypothetical protein|nr:hypothetical protein [Parachlamydia sp.]
MTPKIFLGFLNKGEILAQTYQLHGESKQQWLLQNPFEKAYYNENEYFGFFLLNGSQIKEINEKKDLIIEHVQKFFPKLNSEKLKLYIFPQILIG